MSSSTGAQFYYIFRVGRVVAKIYVSEGSEAMQAGVRLHVGFAQQLAERASWRITNMLRNPLPQEEPSVWKKLFS